MGRRCGCWWAWSLHWGERALPLASAGAGGPLTPAPPALSPEYRGEGVSRLAVGAVAALVDDAAGDAGARGAAGVGLQVVGLLVDDHALADDAVDGDVGNCRLVIS